jgi:hypothetical protein
MWYNERLARGANEGWLRILANPLMPQNLPHSESFFSFRYFSRNSLQNNFAAARTTGLRRIPGRPLMPHFWPHFGTPYDFAYNPENRIFYHSAKNSTIPASVA